MSDTATTSAPTPAQLDVARGYIEACVDYFREWTDADAEALTAASADEIVARALRWWPEGWADFCTYFATDIHNSTENLDR
ncbi:hypothetical protein ACFQZZ_33170 [Nocardia sp. GCM10030253]|uniref:hypothetical protein n=1 Tax=Nocardia sp. GCM10030253 TaxID=3273404 RepID=UPI0036444D43